MATATDAFTGVNGTNLTTYSANWTLSAGNFAIQSNAVCPNSAANECGAWWNAVSWATDHSAQAVVASEISSHAAGVSVRCQASGNYYGIYNDQVAAYTFKMIATVWTQIGSNHASMAVSDVIYAEINGTTLTTKQNSTTLSSTTQNELSGGAPGLSAYNSSASARVDDWQGADLVAQPGSGSTIKTQRPMLDRILHANEGGKGLRSWLTPTAWWRKATA